MKVRDLIAELIKCNMNATVTISVENKPTPDMPYIEDEACSITDLFNEVIISSEQ